MLEKRTKIFLNLQLRHLDALESLQLMENIFEIILKTESCSVYGYITLALLILEHKIDLRFERLSLIMAQNMNNHNIRNGRIMSALIMISKAGYNNLTAAIKSTFLYINHMGF
jgi:hypothetical protein